MQTSQIYVGTSGFTVQHFYPPEVSSADRLKYYAQHFNTVEINSTFYHFPRETTLQKWFHSVSEQFVFAFKVHGSITHRDDHRIGFDELKKWFEIFATAESLRQVPVFLFQFPSSFELNMEDLRRLCDELPENYLYAFEFRDSTWFSSEVFEILRKKNIAIVYSDSPTKKNGEYLWPKVDTNTSDIFYIRFHGATKLYASSYIETELRHYKELISQKIAQEKKVFAYFNNDASGLAASNANTLLHLLGIHALTR